MAFKEPPLPNRVAEMLALADCAAIYVPGRPKRTGWTKPYFLVQVRHDLDLPQRGSVAVESHGGWTYQSFVDAVQELLS